MATDSDKIEMTCNEVLGLLSDYLDGELDAGTMRRIEEHVSTCKHCESFGKSFSAALESFRRLDDGEARLSHDAAERLRKRLTDRLDNAK